MAYRTESVEGLLLVEDPEALGQVIRWIAAVLSWPRFWALRRDWKDLHQEVLLRVVESLRAGRFDSSRDFRTYVQGIARFTALQALSRQFQARRGNPNPDPPAPEKDAEGRALNRGLARRVLDMASEECRELIREYFYEERNYGEIAGSLGVPVGTVKSRLFRCLENAHRNLLGGTPRRP